MMRDETIKHSSQALNKIEWILDPDVFYKLNRSFIINIREIARIEKKGNFVCVMSNGFKLGIPIVKYKKLLFEIERIFGMSI